jgi:hypothetical protein
MLLPYELEDSKFLIVGLRIIAPGGVQTLIVSV